MPRKRECQAPYATEHAGPIRYVEDPYAQEVYGERCKVWLCDRCAQAAHDDV